MLNILVPIHPKLVHFPIALLFTALIFEILGRFFKKTILSEAAFLIYCFATILTPVVVYSGLNEQTRLHLEHPVLERHETWGLVTMWISLGVLPILGWLNKYSTKAFKNIFLGVLILLVVCVTVTSYYGGKMVYEYSVGVAP